MSDVDADADAPDAVPGRRDAVLRRLRRRAVASGELLVPAAPAAVDLYVDQLAAVFASLGRGFSPAEQDVARDLLRRRAAEGWAVSRAGELRITWRTDPPPGASLSYRVELVPHTVADEYDDWHETDGAPLFGAHPDARVVDVAGGLPASSAVTDLGAGSGRNALALARRGHVVQAVEQTPRLAAAIEEAARADGLPVTVHVADALDPGVALPGGQDLVVLSEVVSDLRSTAELDVVLGLAARLLAPSGRLLVNVFVTEAGHLDPLERAASELMWCTAFTRAEVERGTAAAGLAVVEEHDVHDYERAHLPPEAWPPTPWYPAWTRGLDVYDVDPADSPVRMRWLLLRPTP